MRLLNFLAALAVVGGVVYGASGAEPSGPVLKAGSPEHFDAFIAPVLAQHCLECHDAGTKKGDLDLSRADTALAGGKHGQVIVPGKPDESPMWKSVEAGEMPDERPPLSADEKRLLREWIEAGATWSGNAIELMARPRGRAALNWIRRLTVPEYVETVRSATGVNVASEAAERLPPDLRADGFNNTAYNLGVDLGHVEAYAHLAHWIVRRMDAAAFVSQFSPAASLDEGPMEELIGAVGKWLFRGPLEPNEVDAFLRIPRTVSADGGTFAEAAALLVEAMLQSPRFIYRIETQRGDGAERTVSHHELASRLSYMLWGGPPDRELMRAADAGELGERSHVASQVPRMLKDPRAVSRSERFLVEWLDLDRLANLNPEKKRFPQWSQALAADMRAESLAFFREVAWEQKRPLSDLLNAPVTFATPRLAAHYGLPASAAAAPPVRRSDGLLALYLFGESTGDIVRDVSGAGEPIDLKLENPAAVKRGKGHLEVVAPTVVTAAEPPRRLIAAIKKSQALTLEAWVTPHDAGQNGPARILTLSSGTSERNFTIGQDGKRYEIRLRAGAELSNGTPGLTSPDETVRIRPTHLVYTRDASGSAKLYLDGEEQGTRNTAGDLSQWNDGFRLALANEISGDRPWLGVYHRVAIYDRVLTLGEIRSPAASMARYDLEDVPARGGLLTQGSLLTVGGDEASMVSRGLFILHDLLDSRVGSPPPGTDTTPVPTTKGKSQRAVSEQRLASQSCTGCHSKFEPLAFGLEKFDGIGAWHEVDRHGNPLREDGALLLPGAAQPASFSSAAELMDLLAGNDRVRKTLTRKIAQFALGRPLTGSDAAALDSIHEAAQQTGGTYSSIITAVALSDLVRTTTTEPVP